MSKSIDIGFINDFDLFEQITSQAFCNIPQRGDKISIKTENCIKIYSVDYRIFDENGVINKIVVWM